MATFWKSAEHSVNSLFSLRTPGACGGGGWGHLLISCVPMREQKNDEKGYFFELGSAQRCHHLG